MQKKELLQNKKPGFPVERIAGGIFTGPTQPSLLSLIRFVLQDQHGIAVCSKPVFFFHRTFIGLGDQIVPSKSRNHHQ
jgi:hypothetical protein